MPSTSPPPSKQEHLNKLLERGSVFVHLDPRRDAVAVPPYLAKKPQLVLQLGLNFPIPIRDLEIDDRGVRCTLSFNRTPFYCVLPWPAIYALVAEDGQVTVWPSDLPAELVPASESPVRKAAPRERGQKREKKPRPRIELVPTSPESQSPTEREVEPSDEASSSTERPSQPELAAETEPARDATATASATDASSSAPRLRNGRERPPYLRLVK